MTRTAVLGLPRIGPNRELKFALEAHWAGELELEKLLGVARDLRADTWRKTRDAGIEVIPSGDFSLYDQMLDVAWGVGAIPARFGRPAADDLDGYFAMARGDESAKPLEMTKWFDTNYHYLVPELTPGQAFTAQPEHWIGQYEEAKALGIETRPVLIGPFTFLKLAKGVAEPLDLLGRLLPVYTEILEALAAAGVREVQLDEPALVLDPTPTELDLFEKSIGVLAEATSGKVELSLATYFAGLDPEETVPRLTVMPISEVHLDLVRAPEQLEPAIAAVKDTDIRLSLGVVDGRNIWVTDVDQALERLDLAVGELGARRVTIAPSCSLLHSPYSAAGETGIDDEIRGWLAFAAERLTELDLLRQAVDADGADRELLLADGRMAVKGRQLSARTNDPAVRRRVGELQPDDFSRDTEYPERRKAQRDRLNLPDLPTTTIGSFPQTDAIRKARRAYREGGSSHTEYEDFLAGQIREVIEIQEKLDLDVLVHGEPERNDMVEYFGQQLNGFAFSANGWVQSYGSRCVKPPILYGDVSRPRPMTVDWWRRAQGMTGKPMKGMLTGPVTILQWSFVRDDQSRQDTCTQIALAIQDEVLDLERAGAFAIQVDEAALREGLPLQRRFRDDYVRWAVDCFRLTVAPAFRTTQIHTHMCYSEFNDMMEHIVRLDADVLSIEASRSDMEVLDAFTGDFTYPNEIGPGVYDIHSPRVPDVAEIEHLLEAAENRIPREQLWVNPDCGLKTRSWEEALPALEAMMAATRNRRAAAPAVTDRE